MWIRFILWALAAAVAIYVATPLLQDFLGYIIALFRMSEALDTVKPAQEMLDALLQDLTSDAKALEACSTASTIALKDIAAAGLDPIEQMRTDPSSPLYECTMLFCAEGTPNDALAVETFERYCTP